MSLLLMSWISMPPSCWYACVTKYAAFVPRIESTEPPGPFSLSLLLRVPTAGTASASSWSCVREASSFLG